MTQSLQQAKAPTKLKAAHDKLFQHVHGSNLIYNCAWEDPRIDRELMQLDADSSVVMITSAGCNSLDYLLDNPAQIHAIDVNHRQNALLELKMALIKRNDFDDLFEMFGIGSHMDYTAIYQSVRARLTESAQGFWDRRIGFFNPKSLKKSFYYHGTSGVAAWVMGNALFRLRPNIKNFAVCLLDAKSLEEQTQAYELIEGEIWGKFTNWLIRQPALMTLLGVPRPQIKLIEDSYPGGLTGYVKDKLKHVMTELPIEDNYFWRVYITGSYTLHCCPNYLRRENQEMLRQRMDRLKPYSGTVANFLRENPGSYSHYVLLDHQDWLAWNDPVALREEWDLILANSRPGTKILMRSAGLDLSFVPDEIRARLRFQPERTEAMHRLDRVGTYGSTHFAEVLA
ncbi:MAG: BtaA family protein [Verrucomicrobia bacterium]|nr:BtaA family protein [Verrucomicrobiota bacterium]